MQTKLNLLDIQRALDYSFKNAELIKTAFVHKSCDKADIQSSIKLVFLGKKLFDLLICDYACTHSTAKGEKQLMADFEGYMSSLEPEKFIKKHSLTKFIALDSLNEPLRTSDTLCRELFYAIAAAIYKDGGLPALKGFLMPMLRAASSEKHYEPSLDGKVESRADAVLSNEKHISNTKIKFGAKPSAISVTRAITVNTPAEPAPEKKKSLKVSLKKKEAEKEVETEASTPAEKRFIRDPFAPVRLSDELRNFKPKKQAKPTDAPAQPAAALPAQKPIVSAADIEENHKSLLQETVQKNIRTANVLLKYNSKPISKNEWLSTVTLADKVIGTGRGENKKAAEKSAASAAYSAIKDENTAEHKLFLSLCTEESTDTSVSIDYVSKINRYFQKSMRLSSAPVTYEKRRSSQKNTYMVAVIYEGREIAAGKGSSPKEAKQNAAKVACEVLNIK